MHDDIIIQNLSKFAQKPDKKWHHTWEIVLQNPVVEPVDFTKKCPILTSKAVSIRQSKGFRP